MGERAGFPHDKPQGAGTQGGRRQGQDGADGADLIDLVALRGLASDAIAGVIDISLKKRRGCEAVAGAGQYSAGGGKNDETDNGFIYDSVQFGLNGASYFARLYAKF